MIVMLLRDILLIALSFLAGVMVIFICYLNNEEKGDNNGNNT